MHTYKSLAALSMSGPSGVFSPCARFDLTKYNTLHIVSNTKSSLQLLILKSSKAFLIGYDILKHIL